jgi:hypothetical protein
MRFPLDSLKRLQRYIMDGRQRCGGFGACLAVVIPAFCLLLRTVCLFLIRLARDSVFSFFNLQTAIRTRSDLLYSMVYEYFHRMHPLIGRNVYFCVEQYPPIYGVCSTLQHNVINHSFYAQLYLPDSAPVAHIFELIFIRRCNLCLDYTCQTAKLTNF